jgi:hypothetical protein
MHVRCIGIYRSDASNLFGTYVGRLDLRVKLVASFVLLDFVRVLTIIDGAVKGISRLILVTHSDFFKRVLQSVSRRKSFLCT